MILDLCYYGNPILRKKSSLITEFNSELKEFVNNMIETMDAKNGVGLAAPQVGKSLKIFVIRPLIEEEDKEPYLGDAEVYINPIISNPSKDTICLDEGCLSIPRLFAPVVRPAAIDIEWLDINGKVHRERVEGYKARELMHENDHLHGTLYIDRVDPSVKTSLKKTLQNIKKKYSKS
ncbi:MAG TPA: peptide deformylase [Chlamydiales bacterium]|nr:peptide deformylase [Chlamydiales bacterium]